MAIRRPVLGAAGALFWLLTLASCGGDDFTGSSGSSGGGATGTNVVSVVADGGPSNESVNTLFTTVKICVPGSTTNCQTIDHIQVDTGSYGLRVLAQVLNLTLPVSTVGDGSSLVECTDFVDGYSWGPVATADVTIGGESAHSLLVQVIGDSRFPNVPSDCAGTGSAEDTVATFGANGILGIGPFAQDCGSGCVTEIPSPALYYACSSACTGTTVPLASQVANPVTGFATDNNGTIIVLPSVAAAGTTTITGQLIFGIDTESNNASGTQTVLTVDDTGEFTINFNGSALSESFIDSGTNGIYFNDDGLAMCTDSNFADFYCPSSTQNLTATLVGRNGITVSEAFSVGNAETLLDSNGGADYVEPLLAGTYPGATSTFDFGLPFFYGRRVANALEGFTTTAGTGPYVAF
jgi:hypothetical protein